MTETGEVASADMTRPPHPQNSAEMLKPVSDRAPVISRKHSSLFLPSASHMQACAICSYAKVCKTVQVEDRSGCMAAPPFGGQWSVRTWDHENCQRRRARGRQGCWERGLLGLSFRGLVSNMQTGFGQTLSLRSGCPLELWTRVEAVLLSEKGLVSFLPSLLPILFPADSLR